MKKIDNQKNKTGRDYELGFHLEPGSVKGYFGRNVQPEKLEEVYGELSDEELSQIAQRAILFLRIAQ